MCGAWEGISWAVRSLTIGGTLRVLYVFEVALVFCCGVLANAGQMIEHYADGDLVNKDTPIGWMNAGDESLAVWGPEVPKWFLE